MSDSESEDLKVVSCSFSDPYLLVLRDDLSAIVLKYNPKTKELDEIDAGLSGSWISGCIYTPEGQTPLVFLMTEEGGLRVRV
jgi:cleavage and polyadenylation specificity factor subunit 1